MGLLFFNDRLHFVVPGKKRFDQTAIETFARQQGLAFYDTARAVRRLRGNASDAFLDIVEPTDLRALLAPMPHCRRIVTTGGKASEVLMTTLHAERLPEIGHFTLCPAHTHNLGRDLEFWRMPSSSRAYPLALEKKATYYQRLFADNAP